MESKQSHSEQPAVTAAAGYPPPYGYYPQEDEISLIDLWRVLVKKKNTILGITALATIGAVLFALVQPPVYKAEATFLPPSEHDIQALNIQGIQGISIDSAYTLFKQNLAARAPRKAVFEKMGLLDQLAPDRDENSNLEAIFDNFNQSLSISSPKSKKGEEPIQTINLSLEGEDPVLIAEIVNQVAAESERITTSEIINNIHAKVEARIRNLNQEIERLRAQTKQQRMDEIIRLETADNLTRKDLQDQLSTLIESAKQKRMDKIKVLQEAASIAHALGIKEAIGFSLRKISEAQAQAQAQLDLSNLGSQLYNRGYEALEAEIKTLTERESDYAFHPGVRELQEKLKLLKNNRTIEQLKSRINDDPFITSLRDKENELTYLSAIQIDPATVKTAQLDQAAFPPEQRIKPKRKLIVVLGFVLGLMLGIFGAFFSNFLENQRREEETTV